MRRLGDAREKACPLAVFALSGHAGLAVRNLEQQLFRPCILEAAGQQGAPKSVIRRDVTLDR